jgi:hypothetical protein
MLVRMATATVWITVGRGSTKYAKQIWRRVYQAPWPGGWVLKWGVHHSGTKAHAGINRKTRHIIINRDGHDIWWALLHEFVHIQHPKLQHGKEFNRLWEELWYILTGATR